MVDHCITFMKHLLERPAKTLSVALTRELEREIVEGVIEPGTHLVERVLCERFGVSRAVIREVILRLERRGLVKIISRGGAMVSELTGSGFVDAFHFREGLEVAAAEQCARRMNRQQIEGLQRAADAIAQAYEKECAGKRSGLEAADERFHRLVVEGSGNGFIREAWSTAMLHFFRGYQLIPEHLRAPDSRRAILDDHYAIASAICSGEGETSGLAMKRHLKAGRDLMLKRVSEFTDEQGFK